MPRGINRSGIGHPVAIVGLIMIAAGLSYSGITLIQGAVYNSTNIQGLTAGCNASNNCQANYSYQNVNASGVSIQVWYVVTNSIGQQVSSYFNPINVPAGATVPVSTTLLYGASSGGTSPGSPVFPSGKYGLTVFALATSGILYSVQRNVAFTTGFNLLVDSCGGSTCTVTPQGGSATCPSLFNNLGGGSSPPLLPCSNYSPGSQVTVTASNFPIVNTQQSSFQCWRVNPPINGVGCITQNPITLTLNSNYELQLQTWCGASNTVCQSPVALAQPYITATAVSYAYASYGSVSPASATICTTSGTAPAGYTYSTLCPSLSVTTQTFKATVGTQPSDGSGTYVFNGWTGGGPGTSFTSTSPTVTVTFVMACQYQTINWCAQGNASGSVGAFMLFANFSKVQNYQLKVSDSSFYPGQVTMSCHNSVTVNGPGGYWFSPNTQVTCTASNVANGFAWGGWLVDGNPASANPGLSVTLTMNQYHTIMPNILKNSGNGCTPTAGQSTCTTSASGTSVSCSISNAIACTTSYATSSCTATSTYTYTSTNVFGQTSIVTTSQVYKYTSANCNQGGGGGGGGPAIGQALYGFGVAGIGAILIGVDIAQNTTGRRRP